VLPAVNFIISDLATLVPNTQVVVSLTGITRAALKDVRLTNGTLFMPMNDYRVQWWLTSGASLLVCIGWVKSVVHGCDNLKRNIIVCQGWAAF